MIADVIAKVYGDKQNKILVVVKRLEQLFKLKEQLAQRGVKCDLVYGNKNAENKGHYDKVVGKVKEGKIRVIIAVYSCIYKGSNIPELTDLVLAAPFSKQTILKQLIGRIRRKCGDKTRVVVHDFVDTSVASLWNSFSNKRLPVYNHFGFFTTDTEIERIGADAHVKSSRSVSSQKD